MSLRVALKYEKGKQAVDVGNYVDDPEKIWCYRI